MTHFFKSSDKTNHVAKKMTRSYKVKFSDDFGFLKKKAEGMKDKILIPEDTDSEKGRTLDTIIKSSCHWSYKKKSGEIYLLL